MDFEQQFSQWIDESLLAEVPEIVKAFAFLLWEPAEIKGSKFALHLVGTDRFDADDPDWACYEVWEPPERSLPIPETYTGKSWKTCLKKITTLIHRKLGSHSSSIDRLKSREAIGICFVDGDMSLVWKRDEP